MVANSIFDSGALHPVVSHKVMASGVLRTLRRRSIMDGGVLRVVAQYSDPLLVSVSPALVYAFGFGSGAITTNATTATPSGGVGPFTYLWTCTSHSAGVPTINSQTNATTTFTSTPDNDCEFNVLVTDSLGQTINGTASASFINTM